MIIKITPEVVIEIINGDIISTEADVYVAPINIKLNLNYGIAKVLAEYAGDEYVQEIKSKPQPELGIVFTTRGGRLKAKYVFHAVIEDELHDVIRENISKALQHCFRLVQAMGLTSIAIPMLGSPRSKVPYDTFSRLMARSSLEYFTSESGHKGPLTIKFVLYNKELFRSFCDQIAILRQEFFI